MHCRDKKVFIKQFGHFLAFLKITRFLKSIIKQNFFYLRLMIFKIEISLAWDQNFLFYDGFYKSCHFQKRPKMTKLLYENFSIAAMHVIPFILNWYFESLNLNWYHWNLTQVLSMICYTCSENLKAITTLSREILKDVSMMTLSRISSILVPFPYIFRRV